NTQRIYTGVTPRMYWNSIRFSHSDRQRAAPITASEFRTRISLPSRSKATRRVGILTSPFSYTLSASNVAGEEHGTRKRPAHIEDCECPLCNGASGHQAQT